MVLPTGDVVTTIDGGLQLLSSHGDVLTVPLDLPRRSDHGPLLFPDTGGGLVVVGTQDILVLDAQFRTAGNDRQFILSGQMGDQPNGIMVRPGVLLFVGGIGGAWCTIDLNHSPPKASGVQLGGPDAEAAEHLVLLANGLVLAAGHRRMTTAVEADADAAGRDSADPGTVSPGATSSNDQPDHIVPTAATWDMDGAAIWTTLRPIATSAALRRSVVRRGTAGDVVVGVTDPALLRHRYDPTPGAGSGPHIVSLSSSAVRPGSQLVAELAAPIAWCWATMVKTGEVGRLATGDQRLVVPRVTVDGTIVDISLPSDPVEVAPGRHLLTILDPNGRPSRPVALEVRPYRATEDGFGPVVGPAGGTAFFAWPGSGSGRARLRVDHDSHITELRFEHGGDNSGPPPDGASVVLDVDLSTIDAVDASFDGTWADGLEVEGPGGTVLGVGRSQVSSGDHDRVRWELGPATRLVGFRGHRDDRGITGLGVAVARLGAESAPVVLSDPERSSRLLQAGGPPGTTGRLLAGPRATVTGIDLSSGQALDSIRIVTDHGRTEAFGGDGGSPQVVRLRDGERVVEVACAPTILEGVDVISQLTFRTDHDRTFGPYGDLDPTTEIRSVVIDPDMRFVGFYAVTDESDRFISGLSVVVEADPTSGPDPQEPTDARGPDDPEVDDPSDGGPGPTPDGLVQTGVLPLRQPVVDEWRTVEFPVPFADTPVVVVGPLTSLGNDPARARVRNVTTTGFEIRIDELVPGPHRAEELVTFLAATTGIHDLSGITMFVESHDASAEPTRYPFTTDAFGYPPVVVAQVVSDAELSPIARIRDVTDADVAVHVDEEILGAATLAIVAVQPGQGSLDGRPVRVVRGWEVGSDWTELGTIHQREAPILGGPQTLVAPGPCVLRVRIDNKLVSARLDRPDVVTDEAREEVGIILFE